MERLAFGDPRVAAMASDRCVPVRVDADLRPDISERYALDGWPSTLLLTGTGEILRGGNYFDAGALADLLEGTSAAYRAAKDDLDRRAADARARRVARAAEAAPGGPAREVAPEIAAFLLDQVDTAGGFRGGPKYLHADAILFLLRYGASRSLDAATAAALRTLDVADASPLCAEDGRVFRCAARADWTEPATELCAESHVAALRAFVEGAVAGDGNRHIGRVRRIAEFAASRWLAGEGERLVTDVAAELAAACLSAARVLDDGALGQRAIAAMERAILATYRPGRGVAHFEGAGAPVLLSDHVSAIRALLDAHEATGAVPYSMLAEELGHFLVRSLFDERASSFRDRLHADGDLGRLAEPLYPFRQNALAAAALQRLASVSGEPAFAEASARTLAWCASRWRAHGLDAAACGLAALAPPR